MSLLLIGITGGMGAGKSTVCKVFSTLGIPVYDSDSQSKGLMETAQIKHKIVSQFGTSILNPTGNVDKSKLGSLVFNDASKLKELEAIMHPAVAQHFLDWAKEQDEECPYILKEAALLFEAGANKNLDKVIVVHTPLEERVKRVMLRDGVTKTSVLARVKNQLSDHERLERADFVIYNFGESSVIDQVMNIHEILIKIGKNA